MESGFSKGGTFYKSVSQFHPLVENLLSDETCFLLSPRHRPEHRRPKSDRSQILHAFSPQAAQNTEDQIQVQETVAEDAAGEAVAEDGAGEASE